MKPHAFQFIIDTLLPVRPLMKQMFGFVYLYVDERLVLGLRHSAKQTRSNGVWVFTTAEHLESLRHEFPLLPRAYFWRSGKNGWVVLAARMDVFEEYSLRVCDLILQLDPRIGRLPRQPLIKPRPAPPRAPGTVNNWFIRNQDVEF